MHKTVSGSFRSVILKSLSSKFAIHIALDMTVAEIEKFSFGFVSLGLFSENA